MKKGDKSPRPDGFTVVETMIVLAITGLLFASAVLLIGGRQRKTEFAVGVRQIQQSFQQIVNETESGYFPGNANFSCNVNPAGGLSITTSGAREQGSNGDCIFVGKTIVVSGSHNDTLRVYTMAGRRVVNGKDVEQLQDAQPTVIATSTRNPSAPNLINQIRLTNGLSFKGARIGSTQITDAGVGGLTIASTLADFNKTDTGQSGTQNFVLYRAGDSVSWPNNANTQLEADTINASQWSGARVETVQLCFESAGTNQSGLITIGGNAGGVGVALDIKSGKSCGW